MSDIENALLPVSSKRVVAECGYEKFREAMQVITGEKVDSRKEQCFNAYLETAMKVGASLFSTALHVKTARFVLKNMDHVAQAGVDNPVWKIFKTDPTVKNYLKSAAEGSPAGVTSTYTPTKSLADLLLGLSSDEEDVELENRKREKRRALFSEEGEELSTLKRSGDVPQSSTTSECATLKRKRSGDVPQSSTTSECAHIK